jgi:hypothetical protein
MSQYKDVEVGSIVYFWFAANLTTGAAGDGATPLYDVRKAGDAGGASAAPTASGTPTLLTHANYTDGLHEIAIDTTGYAAGEYAVFCTLTISTVNPAGFCGSFKVVAVGDSLHSAAARVMDALPAEAVATAANLATLTAYVDTEVAAIKTKTDNLPTDPADQSAVESAITAATSGLATAANLATVAGYLDTEITAIINTLGAAGAGLTAIPWNAAWDAEVQSECTDALNAYDPPTNAEMEARTLLAASYATAANQTTILGYVDCLPAAWVTVPTAVENADALLGQAGAAQAPQ